MKILSATTSKIACLVKIFVNGKLMQINLIHKVLSNLKKMVYTRGFYME
jgi:hypothetical protein